MALLPKIIPIPPHPLVVLSHLAFVVLTMFCNLFTLLSAHQRTAEELAKIRKKPVHLQLTG